jgi:hypothetical protein
VKSLIEIQRDVLLATNRDGRLTTTRDPAARPAPRFFLGRSAERNVWAIREDVDARAQRALDRLGAAEPTLGEPRGDRAPSCRERVHEILAPVRSEWRGPAYVLPDPLPQDARARLVTSDESDVWRDDFPWLADHFDALAPVAIAFADGRAAAVCHSPRGRTEAAAEAGVETLERYRNQGLATAAVACWARAIQASGRVALYSTSWDNEASRRVARRLSARLYGENWHLE